MIDALKPEEADLLSLSKHELKHFRLTYKMGKVIVSAINLGILSLSRYKFEVWLKERIVLVQPIVLPAKMISLDEIVSFNGTVSTVYANEYSQVIGQIDIIKKDNKKVNLAVSRTSLYEPVTQLEKEVEKELSYLIKPLNELLGKR